MVTCDQARHCTRQYSNCEGRKRDILLAVSHYFQENYGKTEISMNFLLEDSLSLEVVACKLPCETWSLEHGVFIRLFTVRKRVVAITTLSQLVRRVHLQIDKTM